MVESNIYNHIDIYTIEDLEKVVLSREINANIVIREGNITSLVDIEKVNGNLGIFDSIIESLGSLKIVTGNFNIGTNVVYSNIKSLNNLEFVGGNLFLKYSNLKDLGALKRVGGRLDLRDTDITNLSSLEYVGGDLLLPKKFEKIISLANVTIKGKVQFWKDSVKKNVLVPKSEMGFLKFNEKIPNWNNYHIYCYDDIRDATLNQLQFYIKFKKYFLSGKYIDIQGNNCYAFILFYDLLKNQNSDFQKLLYYLDKLAYYYPITKVYKDDAILRFFDNSGKHEEAWELLSNKDFIQAATIIVFEKKLNRRLLNGRLIVKIGGYSILTEFGKRNLENLYPFVELSFEKYLAEKGVNFFDLFIQYGEVINDHKTISIKQYGTNQYDCPKPLDVNTYEYDPSYYEKFFISKEEFLLYKRTDDFQLDSINVNNEELYLPNVVKGAIANQCRQIIHNAEDLYRESIGMPKVGEGWISETELFYKISNYFKNDEVVQHASPKWLGKQHLDIYLPKWNIGIEYQGAQHYEPIDYFGGQDSLEKTIERDMRKKILCDKHDCNLICVDDGYVFTEISKEIEKIILEKSGITLDDKEKTNFSLISGEF